VKAPARRLHPSADANGVISKTIIDATLAPELKSSYSKVVYSKVDLAATVGGTTRADGSREKALRPQCTFRAYEYLRAIAGRS
jgi:hypothetical protein